MIPSQPDRVYHTRFIYPLWHRCVYPVNKLTLRYQMNRRLYLEASQSLERAIDIFYNWRFSIFKTCFTMIKQVFFLYIYFK